MNDEQFANPKTDLLSEEARQPQTDTNVPISTEPLSDSLSLSLSLSLLNCLTNKQTNKQTNRAPATLETDGSISTRKARGGSAKGIKDLSVSIGVRFPRRIADDIEGLERQWFASRSEVVVRLMAYALADHGRVAEMGRIKVAEERAAAAVADLQDAVAVAAKENSALQAKLASAQEELRQARGIRETTAALNKKEQSAYDHSMACFRRSQPLQELLGSWVDAKGDLKRTAFLRDLPVALMAPLLRVHGQDLVATLAAVRGG